MMLDSKECAELLPAENLDLPPFGQDQNDHTIH
jgi:hypothetical protein